MNEFDRELLKNIFAPQVVAIPISNATKDMMIMPDGQIRYYHSIPARALVSSRYSASSDSGLSWKLYPAAPDSPGATVQSPWSGDFLTIRSDAVSGAFELLRSTTGQDGVFTKTVLEKAKCLVCRQPLALRSRKRWVLPFQEQLPDDPIEHPAVLFSDDDGYHWEKVILPAPPLEPLEFPHKGLRWLNCGPEPAIVELTSGRLYMLIRTCRDFYYESYSEDGGETWSEPEPSIFHGTITSPNLLRLSSGRLLFFGNLTRPLPERAQPNGRSTIFTNRDAFHAALSDDEGKTWSGFREIYLNDVRNDADFRNKGVVTMEDSLDKSIHPSQAFEVEAGKVLVAFGQHKTMRRLVLFDPDWLLEKSRKEDFSGGLTNWSVQTYVHSRTGGYRGIGTGHCSYNRRPGAALVPHPDPARLTEVLQIARFPDVRLLEERQGAVWNFPSARKGKITLRIYPCRNSGGTRLILADHWMNPTDIYAELYSILQIELDRTLRFNGAAGKADQFNTLLIQWDLDLGKAFFTLNGGEEHDLEIRKNIPTGLNYLHIQSTAQIPDPNGIFLESVEMEKF